MLQWVIIYKVCVCASESETFPIADKTWAPLPDHKTGEWMAAAGGIKAWEKQKRSLWGRWWKGDSPQRHKRKRGLVKGYWLSKNKGWTTNKDNNTKNQLWKERKKERGVWRGGVLRKVSIIPRSLSLSVTHCPTASHHSYQIHHPRHTSISAQPHAAAFICSTFPLSLSLAWPQVYLPCTSNQAARSFSMLQVSSITANKCNYLNLEWAGI